ncbi:MAG: LysR family transcriptional regulator [Chloroflexi bacterium]|nr:LysR family transcriptional regulator [Chloroflexota bacterium]
MPDIKRIYDVYQQHRDHLCEVEVHLEHVRTFLEITRSGSVTRAAHALGLSQPALTERLRGLERELGTDLFVRTRRGVRLSDAGRALLPHAERALGAIEDGARAVDQMRRGEIGRLAVGASPAVSTYLLPDVLRRFQHAHPKVHLSVRTGHSEEILDLLLRHEVEIGLVREIRHPDIEATPLYEDELVLVVAPSHPFAERGRIRIAELAREHLVTFDRASSYNELTQALFREAGVAPRGVIELDNVEGAKRCVVKGLGVALLPRQAVRAELASRKLRPVTIAGARPIRRRIVAIRRRDEGDPTRTVASFLDLAHDPDTLSP